MISIVTACMNRADRVHQALDEWESLDEVGEIVLVDWSSDERIVRPTGKTKVVRVGGEQFFHLTAAFNLAISRARGGLIAKMDVDYQVDPGFLSSLKVHPKSFHRGAWWTARDDNERSLNGFMFARSDTLAEVGGYNERLTGWGYDDCDLYDRLTLSGCESLLVTGDHIRHIPHPASQRGSNYRIKDPRVSLLYNQQMAALHKWTKYDRKTPWFEVGGELRRTRAIVVSAPSLRQFRVF